MHPVNLSLDFQLITHTEVVACVFECKRNMMEVWCTLRLNKTVTILSDTLDVAHLK